ncbi:hypothetical protein BDW59DRAFT_180595 [Aspergillus cavernicola]|uniref:Zn(2)-C6 fungal-type domain-containing protein n=1 Tax=Aspergillus cavernicola TaxID=176166 RepID=A0ABR4I749_9EURO
MGRSHPSPCIQCRCRKVRCDRRQETCGSCERLQFNCSFQTKVTQNKASEKQIRAGPPERRRASRACLACRRLKARCSGDLPGCENCRQRQRQCHYAASELPPTEISRPINDSILSPLFPIRRQELSKALDCFFHHLYPIPSFAFLHEPSIRQHCRNGTLDQPLALSLMAITKVCLGSDQRMIQECRSWIRKAEGELWEHLHQPSICRVQSLILVVQFYIQMGEFARAYMMAGLAARSATALRLNYERPELGFVAQETRRRVLWALINIDGHFSVGLPEYETIPYAIVYQRLPGSEEEFFSGSSQVDTGPNLLAACLQVSKIQRDVMRLTRQLAISDKPLAELPGLVQEIQNELWRLHADLELTADFSISTTTQPMKMKDSRWFVRYLLASLCWHQVHCDLYRIFLRGYPEAVPTMIMNTTDATFRDHAAEMCRIHSQQIIQILGGVLKHLDAPLLPSYVAICAYQAARLALFLPSQSSPRGSFTTDSAVANANTSLTILHNFFSTAPFAQDIIADLQRLLELADRESLRTSDGRHRHSQLAVHSLIRQASFVDEGY